METFLKDVRYGCRTLLRNPGFTAVAVLSLALGIGANTAVFSFIDTILLRTLPVQNPKELVLLGAGKRRGNSNGPAKGAVEQFSWREYQDIRRNQSAFADILAVDSSSFRGYARFQDGAPEGILSTFVSGNYFDLLGVKAQLGRVFDTSVDGGPSAQAVLSDHFWASRFARNPGIVGQTLRISNGEYTIIGVAPKGFFGTRVGEIPDLWIPVTTQPQFSTADFISITDPQSHFLNLIGRLKPGVSMAEAHANINLVYRRILPAYQPASPNDTHTVTVETTPAERGLSTSVRPRYREPLIVLMVVVALVLAIACANVANLLVALGAKRQREMAVRVAIGANRARVMRQVITEGILLSAVAGALGILIAGGAGKVLVHLISTAARTLPLGFDPDLRVLGFTIAISLTTGVLFSMAPALRASRVDVVSSLKESKGGTASPGRVSFGRALVAGQVALSLILLITAGLLVRSFRNLATADLGFDRQNVLLFKIDSESSGYKQDRKLADLYARISGRVAALPGVTSDSVSLWSFNEGHWGEGIKIPGAELPENERTASLNFVTPGYFRTFGIPFLAGRPLDERDGPGAPLAAVVNETFAKSAFGGAGAALGRSFLMSPLTDKDKPYVVVGVVHDVTTDDVREKPGKLAWLALAQGPVFAGTIAVRTAGDVSGVAASVRNSVRGVEPNLPIRLTTTLVDEIGDSFVSERAIAQLSSFFAALALVLSAIGLYGTISFAVARRTSEIGIRLALGAERVGVLGMVMRDAMTLVAAGSVVGLPLAFVAGRVLKSMLYGLSGFDVVSAVVAVVVLALVAAFAGYLPARRAANLDPMVALRYE